MDVSTFGPPVLTSIQKTITSSLAELNQTKLTDEKIKTLIADYTALNTKVAADITGIAQYTITTFPTELNSINTTLAALDTRKVAYLQPITAPREVSFKSILSDTWLEIQNHILLLTTITGMIFGAIVASHWLITADMDLDKNLVLYHLFYAFFGAILFPIPVLYGVVNPPMWRAPLIPLFELKGGDPGWMSYPGVNLFTYITPTATDLPIGKGVLRIMCGIVTGLIGTSIYLKLK